MRYFILLFLIIFVFSCDQKVENKTVEKQPDKSHEKSVKTNLDLHQHDQNIVMHAENLYACPMNAEYITSDPDTRCVKCKMLLKQEKEVETDKNLAEVQMYTCSMHPQFVSSEATDRCPICKMNLTEVH